MEHVVKDFGGDDKNAASCSSYRGVHYHAAVMYEAMNELASGQLRSLGWRTGCTRAP